MLTSKTQYDINVLEEKMKETDEIIDNFNSKTNSLQVQVEQGLKSSVNADFVAMIRSLWTSWKKETVE